MSRSYLLFCINSGFSSEFIFYRARLYLFIASSTFFTTTLRLTTPFGSKVLKNAFVVRIRDLWSLGRSKPNLMCPTDFVPSLVFRRPFYTSWRSNMNLSCCEGARKLGSKQMSESESIIMRYIYMVIPESIRLSDISVPRLWESWAFYLNSWVPSSSFSFGFSTIYRGCLLMKCCY